MKKLKHVGLIVGMAFIALLFAGLVIYVEDPLLDAQVTTGPNLMLDEWRQLFRYWAIFGVAIGLAAALTWYGLGQWSFSLNDWTNANKKRVVWLSFLLLPLGAFVTGWLLTPPVQEGAFLSTVFYLVNNIGVYYLASVCFSPSSFKYTPLGATTLRRW